VDDPLWDEGRRARHRRISSRDSLHFESAAIALILAAVAVVAVLVVYAPPAPPAPLPTVVRVSAPIGATRLQTGTWFWGANSGLNDPASATVAQAIQATPVRFVRWPGGAAGDEINYTTGVLTNSTGVQFPAVENLSEFVDWCRSLGCHALLELPGEINDPATAAYYVAFTEGTLGFRPDLWEIGNEPAIWTHFGLPWAQWNASQNLNATPVPYAQEVRAYVAAIHRVDPTASVLGLPGIGTGKFGETTWIAATLRENGANVSGVGIHVYPAGSPPNGTASLAQFYQNLTGSRSLSTRVVQARAAISAALPSDPKMPLYITEYGSGVQPGSYGVYLYDFPDVPFVAGEVISGLALNLTQMDIAQVQTPHAGTWLDGDGTFHPLYQFFRVLCPQLGPTVIPTHAEPAVDGLFQVLTESSPTGPSTLLVDNANLSLTITIDATPLGFGGVGPVEVWTWNASTPGPVEVALESAGNAQWTLPPLSLLMVRISGLPVTTVAAHGGGGTVLGSVSVSDGIQLASVGTAGSSTLLANAWSISAAEERWRWEICSTFTPMATSSPADAAPVRTAP
jgi:hypothetical protein